MQCITVDVLYEHGSLHAFSKAYRRPIPLSPQSSGDAETAIELCLVRLDCYALLSCLFLPEFDKAAISYDDEDGNGQYDAECGISSHGAVRVQEVVITIVGYGDVCAAET